MGSNSSPVEAHTAQSTSNNIQKDINSERGTQKTQVILSGYRAQGQLNTVQLSYHHRRHCEMRFLRHHLAFIMKSTRGTLGKGEILLRIKDTEM